MIRDRPSLPRAAAALAAALALVLWCAPGCRKSSESPAPTARDTAPIQQDTATTPIRRENASNRARRQDRARTVYVTESGKKYHRQGCAYLKKSRQSLSREEAQRGGYTACSVCRP